MFYSATEAILEYVRLYQQLACPRSIPLGLKKTHVGKTDSRTRWENIRVDFAELVTIFPSSQTDDWHIMLVGVMSNAMPEERRKYLEVVTGKRFSRYIFERRTQQIYGVITANLRRKGLLIEEERESYGYRDREITGVY